MFKALVGRGHPEFSTNRQQDAQEFLLHFINMVEVSWKYCAPLFKHTSLLMDTFFNPQRNCRSGPNPSEAFRFLVEERIVCEQSQKAKYTQRVDYIVQLPVPMDQATNTGSRLMLGYIWDLLHSLHYNLNATDTSLVWTACTEDVTSDMAYCVCKSKHGFCWCKRMCINLS